MTVQYETQYAIVGRHGRKECEAAVKTFLNAGWFLQGGITVDRDYFAQAMFRTMPIPEVESAAEDRQAK